MISKVSRCLFRTYHCWATVIPGSESIFQYELVKLKVGTKSTCVYRENSGGVELSVDDEQFWRMMCCSRLVESARVRVGTFTLTNWKGIEEALKKIPWESYITKDDVLQLQTTIFKNNMFFPHDIEDIVMRSSQIPSLAKEVKTEKDPKAKKLFFLIRGDKATVSIDAGYTSNRGYRRYLADTPLKETIAASLCYDSIKKGSLLRNNMIVCDFFCGSGVITDEYQSIIRRDFPYLQRMRFLDNPHHGFESWPCHNKDSFSKFVKGLEEEREKAPLMRDYAMMSSDISARAIFCTARNTENLYRKEPIPMNREDTEVIASISYTQMDFEVRSKQLLQAISINREAYRKNLVILANPPVYMQNSYSFESLDKLYQSLFMFICDLKKKDLLRNASVLIPQLTQYKLPPEMMEIATLRQLKLGEHSLCLLSV